MMHATNPDKNWSSPIYEAFDSGDKHYEGFTQHGYQKSVLKKDGFIFADGSLQFKFYIKKSTYMQRLDAAEVELKEARSLIEQLKS